MQQPPDQVSVPVVGAQRLGHGHAVRRPREDHNGVTRARHPFFEDTQVGTGPGRRGEPFHPGPLAHPAREGAARDAHRGHLHHGGAQPPRLADQRPGNVQPGRGDVLPEHAVRQLAAELLGPPVQVFPGVGVHGLLRPAVMTLVHLLVVAGAEPPDGHRPAAGPLIDRGTADPPGPAGLPGRGPCSPRSPARSLLHGIRRHSAGRTGFARGYPGTEPLGREASMTSWPGYGGPAYGHAAMRASDVDRDRAAEVLKSGFAAGRLTKDEYDDHLHRVYTARTHAGPGPGDGPAARRRDGPVHGARPRRDGGPTRWPSPRWSAGSRSSSPWD